MQVDGEGEAPAAAPAEPAPSAPSAPLVVDMADLDDIFNGDDDVDPLMAMRALTDDRRKKIVAHAVPPVFDYLHRPDSLEHLCLYEFTAEYERIKDAAKRDSATTMHFRKVHPFYLSHRLHRRVRTAMPTSYGVNMLPDDRGLAEATQEMRDAYGRRAYLLFVPYRLRDIAPHMLSVDMVRYDAELDLKADEAGEPCGDHSIPFRGNEYNHWIQRREKVLYCKKNPAASAFVQRIMCNLQWMWLGRSHSSAQQEEVVRARMPGDSAEVAEADGTYGLDAGNYALLMSSRTQEVEAVERVLDGAAAFDALPDVPHDLADEELYEPTVDDKVGSKRANEQFKLFVAGADKARTELPAAPNDAAVQARRSARDTPASVEWITMPSARAVEQFTRDALEDRASLTAEIDLVCAMVVRSIGRRFGLNTKQQHLFALVARDFFSHFYKFDVSSVMAAGAEVERHPRLPPALCCYLGGEAGTGKTRAIECIRCLYLLFGQGSQLLLTAMTGAAALNFSDGRTFHSALSLAFSEDNKKVSSDGKCAMVDNVHLIVVDECSMLGGQLFEIARAKLQANGTDRNQEFGGHAMLFVGDFGQLAPVRKH
jgi:hypothetical protein